MSGDSTKIVRLLAKYDSPNTSRPAFLTRWFFAPCTPEPAIDSHPALWFLPRRTMPLGPALKQRRPRPNEATIEMPALFSVEQLFFSRRSERFASRSTYDALRSAPRDF